MAIRLTELSTSIDTSKEDSRDTRNKVLSNNIGEEDKRSPSSYHAK